MVSTRSVSCSCCSASRTISIRSSRRTTWIIQIPPRGSGARALRWRCSRRPCRARAVCCCARRRRRRSMRSMASRRAPARATPCLRRGGSCGAHACATNGSERRRRNPRTTPIRPRAPPPWACLAPAAPHARTPHAPYPPPCRLLSRRALGVTADSCASPLPDDETDPAGGAAGLPEGGAAAASAYQLASAVKASGGLFLKSLTNATCAADSRALLLLLLLLLPTLADPRRPSPTLADPRRPSPTLADPRRPSSHVACRRNPPSPACHLPPLTRPPHTPPASSPTHASPHAHLRMPTRARAQAVCGGRVCRRRRARARVVPRPHHRGGGAQPARRSGRWDCERRAGATPRGGL